MRALLSGLGAAVLLACPAPPGGTAPDGGSFDAGPPIDAPVDTWVWVPVDGSKCASGARAGLGLNRAATGDELLIFLQGGGACWNTGTCVPSLIQYGPLCDYGTLCLLATPGGQQPTAVHVTHPDPFPADGGGAFPSEVAPFKRSAATDRTRPDNPFRNASFAWLPYCTGDLHAGRSEKTYQYKYNLFDNPAPYTVHFAGAANLDAYLSRLRATFPGVKKVYLTGSSAGGYGATLNFERVRAAFPSAEVHLLADSSPFIATPHWQEWRDAWNLQLPEGCAACGDGGFPAVMEHLAEAWPEARMGLLSYDEDGVIAWFFYSPPGAGGMLNPPVGTFNANLLPLLDRYDARAHTKYFVVDGTQHVLWPGYGTAVADGGTTAPLKSRDGGTTLQEFIDGWATGGPGYASTR